MLGFVIRENTFFEYHEFIVKQQKFVNELYLITEFQEFDRHFSEIIGKVFPLALILIAPPSAWHQRHGGRMDHYPLNLLASAVSQWIGAQGIALISLSDSPSFAPPISSHHWKIRCECWKWHIIAFYFHDNRHPPGSAANRIYFLWCKSREALWRAVRLWQHFTHASLGSCSGNWTN